MSEMDKGFKGLLNGISPSDIIRLNCLNFASTMILLNSGDEEGKIYIQNGQIVHAQTSTLSGEEAFFNIMSWDTGNFKTNSFGNNIKKTITKDWNHLIIEALKICDESEKNYLENEIASDIPDKSLTPIRLMIIDDSKVMLSIIKKNLSVFPDINIVAEANSGEEALSIFANTDVDVVLLDLSLPVMDGVEVLKRMLISRQVPILMMSALSEFNQDKVFEALLFGAVDFVNKPKKSQSFSLADRFAQMRNNIREIANVTIEDIRVHAVPDYPKNATAKPDGSPSKKLLFLLSNISNFHTLVEAIHDLPENLEDTSVLVYHPFPVQLQTGFSDFLKYFNSHRIELICGENMATDQGSKKDRALKSSTIYILPPDYDLRLEKVNDRFIIDCSTKNVIEPHSAIESLVSNMHSRGFSIDFVEAFNDKADKVTLENSTAEIILFNYSYPALERNILGKIEAAELSLTEDN